MMSEHFLSLVSSVSLACEALGIKMGSKGGMKSVLVDGIAPNQASQRQHLLVFLPVLRS
jgi:hypothetical protein